MYHKILFFFMVPELLCSIAPVLQSCDWSFFGFWNKFLLHSSCIIFSNDESLFCDENNNQPDFGSQDLNNHTTIFEDKQQQSTTKESLNHPSTIWLWSSPTTKKSLSHSCHAPTKWSTPITRNFLPRSWVHYARNNSVNEWASKRLVRKKLDLTIYHDYVDLQHKKSFRC
jgi:hypothetical protein